MIDKKNSDRLLIKFVKNFFKIKINQTDTNSLRVKTMPVIMLSICKIAKVVGEVKNARDVKN